MRDSFKSKNPSEQVDVEAVLAAIRERLTSAVAWDFVFFETFGGGDAGTLRVQDYCQACEAYHWPEEGHVRWLHKEEANPC